MGLALNVDKKKIDNFWYYYKIHVIVGIVIAIILAITLKDCANNVRPDVDIAYIGGSYIPEPVGEQLKQRILDAGIIEDANGDEKLGLAFQPMRISDEIKSQQDVAMQQKIMVIFAAGDTQLFLLDELNFKKYGPLGAFVSLDDLVQQINIDPEKYTKTTLTVSDDQGKQETHIYGLSLEGNTLLEEIGFDTTDMYIAMRAYGGKDQENEKKMRMQENAYAVLEEILKYN